jgi:hypothetical protein
VLYLRRRCKFFLFLFSKPKKMRGKVFSSGLFYGFIGTLFDLYTKCQKIVSETQRLVTDDKCTWEVLRAI